MRITKKQERTMLKTVEHMTYRNRIAPSIREVAAELQWPMRDILSTTERLRRQGRVDFDPHTLRMTLPIEPPAPYTPKYTALERILDKVLPTDRQADILEFVRVFRRDNRRAPTVREISEAFGLKGTNGVTGQLKALERRGWLSRERGVAGSMQVAKGLAVVGEVS